jgi:copper resistance protein D
VTEFIHAIPAWFQLIFLTLCIGTLDCRLWVLDAAAGAGIPSQEKILVRLRQSFGIGIAALVACSIADLLIGTAEMSGSPFPAIFSLLPMVILKTHFGRVWLIRIAALILLAMSAQAGARYRDSRGLLIFMLILALIISMTESASGHASDAGDFSVAEITDWLHLLAASVWGGGLFALAVVILPVLVRQGDRTAIAGVARRFSRMAGVAVGIIAVTSLYNIWSYVGSFGALWKTAYGLTALAKIVLFLVLIQFAAFNRYLGVPLLQEWAGAPEIRGIISRLAFQLVARFRSMQDERPIASLFMHRVRIEAILIAGVLLCAALLRHEVPARHFSHPGHAQTAGDHADHGHDAHMHYAAKPESVAVRLETNPARINAGTPVSITVHLEDRKGRPLQGLTALHERVLHAVIIGQDLSVFAHIHPEDLGMLTDEMLDTATFPLRYAFPKAGTYLVGIDFATEDGVYSKTASLFVSGQPNMAEPKIDLSRSKNFGPYRVTLAAFPKSIKAGEETLLKYFIWEKGKPVADLQPYLGAPMHLAVVRSDLTQFMHTHGVIPGEPQAQPDHMHSMTLGKFGPQVDADVVFPVKGIYKIFGQVKHKGKVLLFDFMVEVR